MNEIKPGCLCYVVGEDHIYTGRVVTAVRFIPNGYFLSADGSYRQADQWEIDAPWLPVLKPGWRWMEYPFHLRPITDPDVPVEKPVSILEAA